MIDGNKMKEILKKEYLKGLPEQLVKYNILNNVEELSINGNGEISFSNSYCLQMQGGSDNIKKLINYLASELAIKEVDLWLQFQSNKESPKP